MNSSLGSIGIDKYMRNNMFALALEPIHWKTPESNKRKISFFKHEIKINYKYKGTVESQR